jgi:glyoxylase-like metal-dependent hydrolase (beta-lactamase superfamily II)
LGRPTSWAGTVFLLALCGTAAAQRGAPAREAELGVLPVQGNVYMLHAGEAGNVAFQVGGDGVFVVNALRAELAPAIAAKIREVTPAPIRYIVSPNADVDNTTGNGPLAAFGMFGATASSGRPGATLVAHENVLLRLSDLSRRERNPFPGESIPFDNYLLPFKDVYFNGEPIFIMHQPNAHTDGDSIVLFRKSDTLYTGDIFVPDAFPVIDVARGGSVQGLIRALNEILDLAVPARLQDGGTRIIPGRGRLCNEADVVDYRNMVAIVRDRVRALIEEGKTLADIQAARPALDYETRYGPGDAFVRSIHASLVASR